MFGELWTQMFTYVTESSFNEGTMCLNRLINQQIDYSEEKFEEGILQRKPSDGNS